MWQVVGTFAMAHPFLTFFMFDAVLSVIPACIRAIRGDESVFWKTTDAKE